MTQPRLLGGRYELDGVVGRGGMAEVYRARDLRLDRIVAVKTLREDLARDQTFQARFRREAQSAASLNHPSIVAVYDTGEDTTATSHVPFIVMEYVDGRTIRDLLRDDRRLLPERALEITDGVLRALDYSHRAGIVHRDIKPGNVMLNRSGEIKVMDFGIARAIADTQATMTQTAQVIGTAQYLSPEQARGERVDARSDLYSVGCLLYEPMTGQTQLQGQTGALAPYQYGPQETGARGPRRKRKVWPWVAAVLALAVIAAAIVAYQLVSGTAGASALVPRGLVGMKLLKAKQAVRKAGLTPLAVSHKSTTGPYDKVTSVSPQGGTKENKGSTVTLNYNVRPGAQTMPDVRGMSTDAAIAELKQKGWKNVTTGSTEVASLKYGSGEVASSNPPPGKTWPLNQPIVLKISGGGVAVPALVGLSESDATAKLKQLGLFYQTNTSPGPLGTPPDMMWKSTPTPGKAVLPHGSVIIYVQPPAATTPPPPTSPPPSPSTTPSPSATPSPTLS